MVDCTHGKKERMNNRNQRDRDCCAAKTLNISYVRSSGCQIACT